MEPIKECIEFDEFKKEIELQIEALRPHAVKFYNNGNATAGLRLRKSLKELKNYVVITSKNTLTKKEKKKD